MKRESGENTRFLEPARVEGAFLGAAIGDALGWPYEARAKRAGGMRGSTVISFEEWHKRSGGRFNPHEERIGPGEYSDDTQLIISSARSLLNSENWWKNFAFVELPLWTLYERGGGGATRRAARLLAAGSLPWEAKRADDQKKYFDAGGNGIAMRILPHCLDKFSCPAFSDLALDIVSNGVCSHGHPRALVGALAYGYGLWAAFRHQGTLEYGALVQWTINGINEWSRLPDIRERWPTWLSSAEHTTRGYLALWHQACDEMLELLRTAFAGLSSGALSLDEETLEALGCFDPKVNGSGTIAAAASLFLASRHAVDPVEGVSRAAQARGADTDTIASMTGALLGAISGTSWINDFQSSLQDREFLGELANKVARRNRTLIDVNNVLPVQKATITNFFKNLHSASQANHIVMPNGIGAEVFKWDGVKSNSKSLNVHAWRISTDDGQTLFVKELVKSTESVSASTDLFSNESKNVGIRVGLTIVVSNLAKSREFYENALGLHLSKIKPTSMSFGGTLALKLGARVGSTDGDVSLFVEVSNIADCYRRVKFLGAEILSELSYKSGRALFVCRDPDMYVVVVNQHQ